jgi:hypothetical protein
MAVNFAKLPEQLRRSSHAVAGVGSGWDGALVLANYFVEKDKALVTWL